MLLVLRLGEMEKLLILRFLCSKILVSGKRLLISRKLLISRLLTVYRDLTVPFTLCNKFKHDKNSFTNNVFLVNEQAIK